MPSDKEKIEITKESNSDHSHSETELCSPFCQQCHCCHIHIVNLNLIAYPLITPPNRMKTFSYTDPIGKDIKDTILQPPQSVG